MKNYTAKPLRGFLSLSVFALLASSGAPTAFAQSPEDALRKYVVDAVKTATDDENYSQCLDRSVATRFFTDDCSNYADAACDALEDLRKDLFESLYEAREISMKRSEERFGSLSTKGFAGWKVRMGDSLFGAADKTASTLGNAVTDLLQKRYFASLDYEKRSLAKKIRERMVLLQKELAGEIEVQKTPEIHFDDSNSEDHALENAAGAYLLYQATRPPKRN